MKTPKERRPAGLQKAARLPRETTQFRPGSEPSVASLMRLNEASERLWQTQDLHKGLSEMLSATMELLRADFGNIQLFDPKDGVLRIAVQRGFKRKFLEHFGEVSAKDGSACGRALRMGRRILIKDISKDKAYARHLEIARSAGYRAVQSTPLIARDGRPLGIISTHFRQPHRPNELELQSLDLYVRQAADFIERCGMEQVLREREDKLRLSLDAARAGTWTWDAKTREASWDDQFHALYDFAHHQPRTTKTWLARVHQDDQARVLAEIERVRRQPANGGWDIEFRSVRPDGTIVWHHGLGHAVCDAKGKLARLDGIDTDITARKRAEDALSESEADLHRFIDTAATGLVCNTRDLRYRAVNEAYARLVGRPVDEIVGRSLAEVLGKKAMQKIRPYVDRVLRGERVEYETELPLIITGPRWIHVVYTPDRNAAGEIVGWVGSITDITERKRAEAALEENEARMRLAAAAGNVGLWDWDLRTGTVHYSPEWKSQIGYREDEISNHFDEWQKRVHPDDLALALKKIRAFLKHAESPHEVEFRFRHKDGRYLWIYVRAEVLRDAKGKPVRMLGCHIDITARKQAEEALRDLNATLEQRVSERTEELRRSEKQYRLLFELNPNPMWISDERTLRFLAVNEAAAKLYGWSREQFVKMTLKDIRPPEEVPKLVEMLSRQLGSHATAVGEWRHWKQDHTPIDAEMTISSLQFMGRDARLALVKDITERKKAEQALQADLIATKKLAELGMLSAHEGDLKPVLSSVLETAIAITGADFGNIQLLSPETGKLKIVAHQGFPSWWLEFWDRDAKGSGACGKALQNGERLIVEDVEQCSIFARTRALKIQRRAGVRAMQCTPLVSRSGKALGVFSTHYRTPQRPGERVLGLLDLLARQAADLIERAQSEEALRASEVKYRQLYETLHDAFVTVDLQGRIQEFNSSYVQMLGYSAEELRRMSDVDLTPAQWHPVEAAIVRKQVLPRGFSGIYEKEYRRKDGRVFPVELRTCLIRSADGKPQGMWAIVRDITTRKKAEARMRDLNASLERRVADRTLELIQREERLRAILNTVVDAIITIDGRGIITGVNPATERMFGYTEADMVGQNVKMLMPSPYREEHEGYIERFNRTGVARIIGIGREAQAQRKDGTLFPIELAVSQVDHAQIFTGVIRDISRRRDLEKEILKISENERASIGQDLHDDLGQQLAGIWLLCDSMRDSLAREGSAEVENAAKITKLLKNALALTRSLARGLHPVALQAGGLVTALNELAARTRSTSRTDCRFICSQSIHMDDTTATHLYRIAQEAVTNAVKHTDTKSIDIELAASHDAVTLSVEDAGQPKGKAIAHLDPKRPGMGLRIMRYRADMIGGILDIKCNASGIGTTVVCTVPAAHLQSFSLSDHGQERTDQAP